MSLGFVGRRAPSSKPRDTDTAGFSTKLEKYRKLWRQNDHVRRDIYEFSRMRLEIIRNKLSGVKWVYTSNEFTTVKHSGETNASKTKKNINTELQARRYAAAETTASANDKCQRLLGVGQERDSVDQTT